MKLKQRHIIPYLEYGLKVLVEGIVCEVEGLDLVFENILIAERVKYKLNRVKPILIPLKESVNDDELLKNLYLACEFETDTEAINTLIYYIETQTLNDTLNVLKSTPYWVVKSLLARHYDIEGLIEKGLAITKEDIPALEVVEKVDNQINLFQMIDSVEEMKKEYDSVLKSGMFFEWFPELTGEWKADEIQWCKLWEKRK